MSLRKATLNRLNAVCAAETTSFVEMIHIAGLNPATALVGADLGYLDLRNEDFAGFDLTDVDFSHANLCGADFSRASGLEYAVLEGIITDDATLGLSSVPPSPTPRNPWYRRRRFNRRIFVHGNGPRAARLTRILKANHHETFEVVGEDAMPNGLAPESLHLEHIWAVVVADEDTATIPREELLACKKAGIRVSKASEFYEDQLGRVELEAADQNWVLYSDGAFPSTFVIMLRRIADIIISLGLLFSTLPLMLVVALLIRLDSPGPVFYRQRRAGLGGRPFTLLKFRSMRMDAEAASKPQWANTDDPRITRIGHFIRRTRIDELPQLLNILRGEMSFIGPRPERPEFIDQLSKAIPFYADRDWLKPGLTGWSQVSFPYGASVDDARHKLSYDLYYMKHRSLLLDVRIILKTIRVILFREGTR